MIGIFGGTGVTGGQVVAALKAKGADFKCIVRDPDAAKAKLGDDTNVVQGDLANPASLDSALEGIDTLYLLCGHSPALKEFELNGLAAAKRAGVSYIVESSGSEKGITADSLSEIMQSHYEIENEVRNSGIKWAISRPNFFMSNLMGMAEPIAKMGKLITTLPQETTISMIHPADIGESVAELLTNQDRAGQEYFLTGPKVTMGDVVKAISEAVGKEIEYLQVPPEAAKKAMEEKGMPDWLMAHMGAMMVLAERGDMAGETDWVQQLTGHTPRTLAEWLSSTKAAFGG
jgi:uncharacterized protein YbjT (DUF2867 family)